MKIKAFLFLLLVLTLLVPCASAESIFPTLVKPEEKAPVVAPSYCMIEGKEPDEIETNANGDAIVTFKNVDENGYNNFGRYLGKMNFSVGGQEVKDDMYGFVLSDGETEFSMIYEQNSHTLKLIYPQGVDIEGPLFTGYKLIWLNDTLSNSSLGEFTFTVLGQNYRIGPKLGNGAFLDFLYHNTSTERKYHYVSRSTSYYSSSHPSSNLFESVKYVYINHNNTYEYKIDNDSSVSSTCYGYVYRENDKEYLSSEIKALEPLTTTKLFVGIELPATVQNANDGTAAMLLHFKTGEKYILLLRRNGILMK